ncbi:hypothetical protein BDN72DRAFT_883893 [Pluteus cervinus]|uniref:Uncharacterized protein n=1 Tax=Pluteus cervinus TaxID=181527 RepID=A0ACD3A1Q7_9AGAR|nr:hypothetical protein BDN72DRAFT_883893 [Pluteus cervinus]
MLTILLMTLAFLRARAAPASAGSEAIAHTLLLGVEAQSNPSCADVRTLYEIVKNCVFTIAACVYRAVHQNIPNPTDQSLKAHLKVKMKITFYALIAPELVIFWAMRQRYGARQIVKEVKKHGLQWHEVHGQFAQMGGFAIKVKCNNNEEIRVLHPTTLIDHLKNNRLNIKELTLTKEEVRDKSKGDFLSKGIVALQTTWFICECVARLVLKLPLLELEVVTLAFATLNILTYFLWWHKPLDVYCPIYLHLLPPGHAHPSSQEKTHTTSDLAGPSQQTNVTSPFAAPRENALASPDSSQDGIEAVPRSRQVVVSAPAVAFIRGTEASPTSPQDWRFVTEDWFEGGFLQEGMVARGIFVLNKVGWVMGHVLIKDPFLAVAMPFAEMFEDDDVPDEASHTSHVNMFYGTAMLPGEEDIVWAGSCFIGMIFGAIHFFSWDSPFRTHSELLLWRCSSIVLVIQPFLLLVVNLSNHTPPAWLKGMADLLGGFSFFLAFYVGTIAYILARFCLLVLAFLSLLNLPHNALRTASWTSYIPHF